jgi:ankyrin repeat protein
MSKLLALAFTTIAIFGSPILANAQALSFGSCAEWADDIWFRSDADYATMRACLDSGLDPNLRDEYGTTPLHYAAANGDFALVRLLLERALN